MNSFNFQIIPVANLAAIVTPFPDHICYFTEDTENYYIWENNALKEIFADVSNITWNNITGKPTTITGYGITDAVKVNNGTVNYVAKFTPDGQTIGNSQIQDNGTSVGIFIAPNPIWRLYANGNTLKGGYFSTTRTSTNVDLAIGVYGSSSGASSQGMNIGIFGQADSNNLLNIGVYGASTTTVAGVNIGMYAEASLGISGNYSVQLKDGTESVAGRYLRNMTTDGKANWANINITEVTNGLSSTLLGAPNGIATLDNNSKLVISQMPISVMDYKGTYDIVTNTPSLVDGTGNQGDVYVATTAGTRTFGAGNTLTVSVGDWLIYNGTKWEKTLGNNVGSGTVTSVGITLGTTGTDVNISNSPITSSGNINLNIPTASSTARGLLSTADWTTFNSKIGGSGQTGFIPRFSSLGSNIIGMSRIYEENNALSVGIGASTFSNTGFYLQGISGQSIGASFINHSGGTSFGYGVTASSSQTSGTNIGISARTQTIGTAVNIGIESLASGGSNNYAARLSDGTQGLNKFLKCVDTDGKSNWANITAADVSGAVGAVGGTNNYLSKFTPNGTTIGNSLIQDNGATLGIGASPNANILFYIYNTSKNTTLLSQSTVNNGVGLYGQAISGTGTVTGTIGFANSPNSTINIGTHGKATNTATTNIGLKGEASGGTNNYAIQLIDGSETLSGGKFLKDTGDGKANWSYLPDSAQIMCSDMTSAISADTTTPKAIWVAPCAGQLTDAFASLRTPQTGGSTFTVLVKTGSVTVATLTFTNGAVQWTSTNPAATTSFAKGDQFYIFVSQVGDGTARSLLVTLNYLRT